MRIALLLLVPCSLAGQEATGSLAGRVVTIIGDHIANVTVELDSGGRSYHSQTDGDGAFQFRALPAGDYTLTFLAPGFKMRLIKRVGLSERQQKRIPDVTLDIGSVCGAPARDLILLSAATSFGRLSGSVVPPLPAVEVTLVCRTFSSCGSTKTDSNGRFSFDMLSPGVYGLNFRRDGFYPELASGYSYWVDASWESAYDPVVMERCRNSNCDPKLRPKRPVAVCE